MMNMWPHQKLNPNLEPTGLALSVLFVIFRPLTRPEGVRFSESRTPIETTTAEERARGESSFVIREERRFGITRKGFFVLAALGYVVFLTAFVIALVTGWT